MVISFTDNHDFDITLSKLEVTPNPILTKFTVDMTMIFECQAKSEPKYSPALLYLMSKKNEIKHHIDTATMIAHGIEYINELLVNDVTDESK